MPRLLSTALLALLCTQGGCYYGQLASGQIGMLWHREPIEEVLSEPDLDADQRALLALVEPVREFARALGLSVENRYTSFVDWPGDRIVTTLVRTPPDSLEAVGWWFPIVGRLPYKGYFDQARAEADAARLRDEGRFDVCVSGVTAYSTLGWIDDPVTSPMLAQGAASLVETLLHELVHATAFLDGEVEFNESVAQFIGQEAAVRFFERFAREDPPGSGARASSDPDVPGEVEIESARRLPDARRVRAAIEDRRLVAAQVLAFRDRLVALGPMSGGTAARVEAEQAARRELAALPLQVLDAERVAATARLSNACLALRGTYVRDLPRHAAVLNALGGDLEAMIARLADWAEAERPAEAFFDVQALPRNPRPSGEQAATSTAAHSAADQLDHALLHESAKDR